MKRRRKDRRTRKSPSQIRRSRLERLEDRHLLAGDTLFFDSFEAGEWAGKWVEDSQNDWSTSSRNSTDGSFSAEVVGRTDNATLTLANSIDLSGYDRTRLTFDWAITRSFDLGEYLAFDLSTDGGVNWQNDILRLDGDIDAEGIWHHESVDLTPYASSNFKIRFRSLVSAGNELAGVDNVQIAGITTLPAPPGLVSYWSADGNALDHQGTNDGILFNGASYDQGQVGSGFVFDGINDRIDVADSASLELTESMTVETWVRVDSYPSVSNHGLILFRGDDRGGLDPYQLRVDKGGTIRFQVQNAANESAAVLADIPTGQFIHVVATLDHSTDEMKLYLNSVLVASTTTTIRPFGPLDPASNPSVGIGNHGGFAGGSPHNFPFHGVIDELKLYNVPLSQADIEASFQATKGNLNTSVSIDDATVVEGEFNYNYVDDYVSQNAGGMKEPRGMTIGPDGNLYISSSQTDSILRYDGSTGAFIDEFVEAGSGGLDFPRELQFHNGYLFVASALSDSVLRFDAVTGAFIDEFVTAGSGGLVQPRGLLFGSNNDLYVTSAGSGDAVFRYDATTGQFIDQFISAGSGGLDNPTGLATGPDGNFYVTSTSSSSNAVIRYTPNGEYIDYFITSMSGGLDGPVALLFDQSDGLLYVSGARSRAIHAYDISTGAYIKDIGTSQSGLIQPNALVVNSSNNLLVPDVATNSVKRFSKSSSAFFEVRLSTVWTEAVSVDYTTAADSATDGVDYQFAFGTIVFAPGETAKVISVPILEDNIVEGDENFFVNLSNATGATILDSQGKGTIFDNDQPNQLPVAVSDQILAQTDIEAVIDVLANDSDPDGDSLSILSVTSPSHGQVDINANNTLSYTSAPGYSGPDSFDYTISDGKGGTATATVTINVSAVAVTRIFVADISFQSRKGGKDWRANVEIRDEYNLPVQGVRVRLKFGNFDAIYWTDINGQIQTDWQTVSTGTLAEIYTAPGDISPGDGWVWDQTLYQMFNYSTGVEDRDGDGRPDKTI